jgi:hypothetical protein
MEQNHSKSMNKSSDTGDAVSCSHPYPTKPINAASLLRVHKGRVGQSFLHIKSCHGRSTLFLDKQWRFRNRSCVCKERRHLGRRHRQWNLLCLQTSRTHMAVLFRTFPSLETATSARRTSPEWKGMCKQDFSHCFELNVLPSTSSKHYI